jgi:hypothetical protein
MPRSARKSIAVASSVAGHQKLLLTDRTINPYAISMATTCFFCVVPSSALAAIAAQRHSADSYDKDEGNDDDTASDANDAESENSVMWRGCAAKFAR